MRKADHLLRFPDRLKRCLELGRMAKADLAAWFDRPYATVHYWISGRTKPGPLLLHDITTRMLLLEKTLKKRDGFPVPFELKQQDRGAYIRAIYARVSRRGASRKGL